MPVFVLRDGHVSEWPHIVCCQLSVQPFYVSWFVLFFSSSSWYFPSVLDAAGDHRRLAYEQTLMGVNDSESKAARHYLKLQVHSGVKNETQQKNMTPSHQIIVFLGTVLLLIIILRIPLH